MTKYEYRAILLSTLAATFGLALAFYFKGGHWFSRAGAVITAIAIVFAAQELRERLVNVSSFAEEQFELRRPELLKHGIAVGLNQSETEAAVAKVESELRAEIAAEVRSTKRRLLRVEVALLVAGTLIWGFGDLPLDFLFKQ